MDNLKKKQDQDQNQNGIKKTEDELPAATSSKNPADSANWFSYATFSWMTTLMLRTYHGKSLTMSNVPQISHLDSCQLNTTRLEELWNQELEKTAGNNPKLSRVIWKFVRRRVCQSTIVFLICIILGFLSPTIMMKKVLEFSSSSEASRWDGALWISLLILFELIRVFCFTLTWAMAYRTGIRVKSACMGLLYKKLFKIENVDEKYISKLQNVIQLDCTRIYDMMIWCQIALGGPIVLILSTLFIVYQLGFISLFGLLVFPLSIPIQYYLAKLNGKLRLKIIQVKDERISFISQSITYFKFLKMFGWEKHFERIITEIRRKERKLLLQNQLIQSITIVIGPILPSVGSIISFVLYINTGQELTSAQAFTIIALYMSRVRPSFETTRIILRIFFEYLIGLQRIQCFTIFFLFSLFGYSIKSTTQIFNLYYSYKIFDDRVKDVLLLPEITTTNLKNQEPSYGDGNGNDNEDLAIFMENATILRKPFIDEQNGKKSKKKKKKDSKSKNQLLAPLNNNESSGFQLQNLDLRIKKGSFIGICGFIGSGKTTLLDSIVGLISLSKGRLEVQGDFVYSPQTPFIFRGTVKDNILFGSSYNSDRYEEAVKACCLLTDFENLPASDLTEINDDGSNLSGGQKLRISLARALYHSSSRDIFILDDPFSGLDGKVSKMIFKKVLKKLVKRNKTVLLSTHTLKYLRECTEILVLDEGTIVERGTHEEFMMINDSRYSNLVVNSSNPDDDGSESNNNILLEESRTLINHENDKNKKQNEQSLNDQLIVFKKGVECKVYGLYVKSAGGFCSLLIVLFGFLVVSGSIGFSSWWLKNWFNSSNNSNNSTIIGNSTTYISSLSLNETNYKVDDVIDLNSPNFKFNRDIYVGLIGVIIFASFLRAILFVYATIRAAQNIHQKLLSTFFQNRLKYIEEVGSGHILNLFSRDMEEVDTNLPMTMDILLQNIFVILTVFILVSLVFPYFLFPLGIIFLLFLYIRKIFNSSIQILKKIESESKTPLYSKVSESFFGLSTIKAFGKESQYIQSFYELTDKSHSVFYIMSAAMRWLSFRLDILAVGVTLSVSAFILIFHGKVPAPACGLALAYASQLSGIFQFTTRLASETESKFVSVERIKIFLNQSQPEPSNSSKNNDNDFDDSGKSQRKSSVSGKLLEKVVEEWPSCGNIEFKSVCLGYCDENNVLKNISFCIKSGQKIGVVGRTGSGKSSLSTALFRLLELKSGSIVLDGIDISTISISKLRQALCIIPQDAIQFSGTIRFNLDPDNQNPDEVLWSILEKTGLRSSIDSLDSIVNLSSGQKQLLSISRALLRKSKCIFIDEATSKCDVETSAIIDRLLVEEFNSSTVFIVTHRMSALSYCDYLIILDDGKIIDMGPIEILTKKPEFLNHFKSYEKLQL